LESQIRFGNNKTKGSLSSGVLYRQQNVCASRNEILSKGILTAKTVLSVSQTMAVSVKMLNPTNETMVFNRRQSLVMFTQITSDVCLLLLMRILKQEIMNMEQHD
jgi:hypothetical protein